MNNGPEEFFLRLLNALTPSNYDTNKYIHEQCYLLIGQTLVNVDNMNNCKFIYINGQCYSLICQIPVNVDIMNNCELLHFLIPDKIIEEYHYLIVLKENGSLKSDDVKHIIMDQCLNYIYITIKSKYEDMLFLLNGTDRLLEEYKGTIKVMLLNKTRTDVSLLLNMLRMALETRFNLGSKKLKKGETGKIYGRLVEKEKSFNNENYIMFKNMF